MAVKAIRQTWLLCLLVFTTYMCSHTCTYVCRTNYTDGVLGGYGSVTPMDTRDSNVFLDKLLAMREGFKLQHVADCGAGECTFPCCLR